ncbi:MAG: glycosyltransferase family 4 protein [Bacteroidia bacterium]
MKVLFFYTEIADYFIKCCENLAEKAEVHIIRWPVNKEAPFVFSFSEKLKVYDKNKYSITELETLVKNIDPNIIICSGWIDKDYLRLTKPYYKKIPTLLTCDTHWTGSPKQYLATFLSRLFLLNIFSHAWVPGNSQAYYVSKLGFKSTQIKTGFYCCDLEKFNNIYSTQFPVKKNKFPKRFLFVGRYYTFKGIEDLWKAFIQLQDKTPNEWELWCLGTGDLVAPEHPKIKHFGFVQPNKLSEITAQCGVFVLPSHFEPWGVVVQEYAASGFPLLTSDSVGANESFLKENENGFSYKAKKIDELEKILKKFTTLSEAELLLMGEKSHVTAQAIHPKNWTNTLITIYNEFNTK